MESETRKERVVQPCFATLILREFSEPREEPEEEQEDQGTLKQLGWAHPTSFTSPWSSRPSFWLFLGYLELPQGICFMDTRIVF